MEQCGLTLEAARSKISDIICGSQFPFLDFSSFLLLESQAFTCSLQPQMKDSFSFVMSTCQILVIPLFELPIP